MWSNGPLHGRLTRPEARRAAAEDRIRLVQAAMPEDRQKAPP
jgi:hypothetical protein